MNLIVPLAAAVLALSAETPTDVQAAPSPDKVCLNVRDIQRTETPDDRTIVFYMRDGKIWRNRLKSICPLLKTSPYSQVLRNDQVCANQQFIHVAQSGYTCVLGGFVPLSAKP